MPRRRSAVLMLLMVTLITQAVPAPFALAAIPTGFAQTTPLTQLSAPVAMDFSPDETLLFITEKAGRLRIADVSPTGTLTLRATSAIDLTTKTCSNSERGLLGVAADPDFVNNRYVYMYYTFNRANSCETNTNNVAAGTNSPVNRVSRFTVGSDGIINPATEGILIDNIYSPGGNHNGGDVQFGNDGYLYISVGDGGCDYAGGGCAGGNDAARDSFALNGKILRIIPDPTLPPAQRIPNNNPYKTNGSICALAGHTTSGNCQETFAYGLRNPFRIAFDPNTTTQTTFYINDVGQGHVEEIDMGELGVDYRWNQCEGTFVTDSNNPCPPPAGNQRDPIHQYDRSVGASITGGAVIPNGVWPSGYAAKYLFADYVVGKIFMIDPASPSNRTTFADGLNSPIHLQFGPGPNGVRSLYYTSINTGQILRITPTNGGNVPPTAVLSANPQFGSKTVTFNGASSSDPDGSIQDYLWNFGDGNTRTTQSSTTVYTYPVGGNYTASLQVRDNNGALSNTATIAIQTNNAAPVPVITLPAANATFGVGDTITLQGSATDIKDGSLPASGLRWEVILHHRAGQSGAHTHPFFGPQTGTNITFTAPAPEDLDAASNSYLEIRLTATDSDGASATVSRDFLPAKVALLVRSVPNGMKLSANGMQFNDGDTIMSWRGYQINLAGLPQRVPDGRWLALSTWEDNSTSTTRTVTTPAEAQTYTAVFSRTASLAFMPLVQQR